MALGIKLSTMSFRTSNSSIYSRISSRNFATGNVFRWKGMGQDGGFFKDNSNNNCSLQASKKASSFMNFVSLSSSKLLRPFPLLFIFSR